MFKRQNGNFIWLNQIVDKICDVCFRFPEPKVVPDSKLQVGLIPTLEPQNLATSQMDT